MALHTLNNHFQHHRALLQSLYQFCKNELPFNSDQATDTDLEFICSLQALAEAEKYSEDYNYNGQQMICRIVANYPKITPTINRDLFWHFGGDCLHYMSDEEIDLYQQVDELLHENGSMEYSEAKAKLFQLH